MRPPATELVLTEVFNRLQGELRMHGFETILASASGMPSPGEMQRVAELGQSSATVALERVGVDLTSHVWFIDRETLQARVMSVAVAETEETPALLALKTVELLRSSLRERSESVVPVPKVVTKSAPPPTRGTDTGKLPEVGVSLAPLGPRIGLRLDGALIWYNLRQSALFAPALSVGYRVAPRWELAARFVVPLSTNHMATARASADFRADLGVLESRWSMVPLHRTVTVESLIAVGVARCSASGSAVYPVEGRKVTGWAMAAALGLGGWIAPSPRWSLGGTTRMGVFAPKPILRVDNRDEPLGRPWLEVSMGVRYSL